jgi:hypothetical protein
MKLRTVGLFSLGFFLLLLITLAAFTTACSNNSPSSSATATPTPNGAVAAYNLSGSVTYQGSPSTNHIYVIIANQAASGPISIIQLSANGGSYSFTGLTAAVELIAGYDAANAGLTITGTNLTESNGSSTNGSGDVVCLNGYTSACPNTKGFLGTLFSTTSTVNIVFGGTTGQSGTNCTQ